jgi:hypothetical protein
MTSPHWPTGVGCVYYGGRLHRADYPRKPRGVPFARPHLTPAGSTLPTPTAGVCTKGPAFVQQPATSGRLHKNRSTDLSVMTVTPRKGAPQVEHGRSVEAGVLRPPPENREKLHEVDYEAEAALRERDQRWYREVAATSREVVAVDRADGYCARSIPLTFRGPAREDR